MALGRYWPLLTLLVLVVIFFHPFLFQKKVFLAGDVLYAYYPWKAGAPPDFTPHNILITDPVNHSWCGLYNEDLKRGRMMSWNPYILGGIPSTGVTPLNGMPGRYNPLKILAHRLLPPLTAMSILLLVHLLGAGIAMFLYLREIGIDRRGGLIGAVAFMFCGTAMVWLEFENLVPTASLFPLTLFWLERCRKKGGWGVITAGAATYGLMILVGHPQYVIYSTLLMGFYFLFLLGGVVADREGWATIRRLLIYFTATVFVGALVAGMEIVPTVSALLTSGRIRRTFEFGDFFTTLARVPFRYYVTLIFPNYFGSPLHQMGWIPQLPTQEYMNYNELCLYLGVPTVFLLLVFLLVPKGRHGWFFLGSTLLAALMMSGSTIYYPLFALVPGMDRMNPTRLTYLFSFSAAVCAAIGVQQIFSLDRKKRVGIVTAVIVLLMVIFFVGFFGDDPVLVDWFAREPLTGGESPPPWLVENLSSLRHTASPVIAKPLGLSLAAAAAVLLLVFSGPGRLLSRISFGILLMLLSYDLISYGRWYNTVVSPEMIYKPTPAIEFLRRQPGPFRVVQDCGNGLYVNDLAPFRIEELGGYSSFYPSRTTLFMAYAEYGPWAAEGLRFDRWVMFTTMGSPFFNAANVRYILTAPFVEYDYPNLRPVFRDDLVVYENLAALPRVYAVYRCVVSDTTEAALSYMISGEFSPWTEVVLEEPPPAGFGGADPPLECTPATILRWDREDLAFRIDMPRDGWVVVADSFAPGWRARLDGVEAKILPANGAFRAMAASAGSHLITMKYRSGPENLGRAASVVGVLLLIGGWILDRRSRKARRG